VIPTDGQKAAYSGSRSSPACLRLPASRMVPELARRGVTVVLGPVSDLFVIDVDGTGLTRRSRSGSSPGPKVAFGQRSAASISPLLSAAGVVTKSKSASEVGVQRARGHNGRPRFTPLGSVTRGRSRSPEDLPAGLPPAVLPTWRPAAAQASCGGSRQPARPMSLSTRRFRRAAC
jgi:hypothetical protein